MSEARDTLGPLRAALDDLGAAIAPAMVAEAQEIAIERATSALADEMTRSLLDHAEKELALPHSRRRAPEPAAKPGQSGTGLYVYGVGWSTELEPPRDLVGVDGVEPPFAIDAGQLRALASRVELGEFGEEGLRENLNDVAWLEEKARSHEAVLEAALAGASVVPLRLCTIYRSDEHVKEMLTAERSVFADALARLAGKAEWSVKVLADPDALERAASGSEEERESAESTPALAYLESRRREHHAEEEIRRVGHEWADLAHRAAAAIAEEALLNPLQNPELSGHEGEMLLNGVYLVADEARDELRGALDEVAEELARQGATVELSGPWPAYNFVKGSIEAAR